MKIIIALLLTLFILKPVHGQKKWSLNDCINYAHENNIDIKQQKLRVNVAENDANQSRYNLLPDLNASVGRSYSLGRSQDRSTGEFVDENFTNDNYYIGGSATVFEGLKKQHRIKHTQLNLQKHVSDLDVIKNNISLQIASAYLNALYAKELLEVSKNQLELIQQRVDRVNKMVNVGNAAKGDLYEIQAQMASEKTAVTEAQNNRNLTLLGLVQLLDLDSTDGFDIVSPDINMQQNTIISGFTESYLAAIDAMPQITSAKLDIEANQSNIDIQKSNLYPSLNISYGLSTNYSNASYASIEPQPYANQFNEHISTNIGFRLNIPVFNKFQVRTAIQQAQLGVKQAELAFAKVKLELYKDIQQARADAIASLDKYNSAKEAVKYNQEAYRYTEQKYDVGMVNAIDYNTAKNNLIKAEADELQAKYQYVFQLKILDFYTGKPLQL